MQELWGNSTYAECVSYQQGSGKEALFIFLEFPKWPSRVSEFQPLGNMKVIYQSMWPTSAKSSYCYLWLMFSHCSETNLASNALFLNYFLSKGSKIYARDNEEDVRRYRSSCGAQLETFLCVATCSQSRSTTIFNHYVVAHWCATDSLQVCPGLWGDSLAGQFGDLSNLQQHGMPCQW